MASIKNVPIADLKLAKWNPKSRLDDIGGLVKSIQEVGLLVPILITENNAVVEGHRRVAAFKRLKFETIQAIQVSNTHSPATIFAHVNANNKKHSGNERLQIYLSEPEALQPKIRAWMEGMEEDLGVALVKRMADEGLSFATYRVATTIAKLSDKDTPETLKKIVKWLLHFKCAGIAQRALNAGTAPGIIMAAVERNKAIRPKFDVS